MRVYATQCGKVQKSNKPRRCASCYCDKAVEQKIKLSMPMQKPKQKILRVNKAWQSDYIIKDIAMIANQSDANMAVFLLNHVFG